MVDGDTDSSRMLCIRLTAANYSVESVATAQAALDAMTANHVTHSQWVPTMFARLLALPAEARAAFACPTHRLAMHSGGPCSIEIKRRMIDWWGPILYEYYSGSESVGFTHADSAEWLAHNRS